MTKFHKIVIIASALGLLTYFLPIVEGNGVQFSLSNQIVSEYTHNRGWIIKIPFVVTLIIALVGNTKFVFGKIKSIFFHPIRSSCHDFKYADDFLLKW